MPNHVTNIVSIKGERLIVKEMLEKIKNDEYGIGTIDFNKIIPMPESLEIESGSRTTHGLHAYKDFIDVYTLMGTEEKDLLNIPKSSEEAFLKMRNDVKPDEWELGRTAFQNQIKYGAADWYDWRIGNWGTKWNAYGYEKGVDYSENEYLCFETAWSAPHPILDKLAEMYPDIEFMHEWADEDIGQNCGMFEYEEGTRSMEYYPNTGKERIEFAAKVMDSSPEDWNLYLNASGKDYIYAGDEEYELVSLFGKPALFSDSRITKDDIPQGLFCYDLRHADDGDRLCTIEPKVTVNHGGSIITAEPLEFGKEKMIPLSEDTAPCFLGEQLNVGQFMRGEFEGPDEEQDLGGMEL